MLAYGKRSLFIRSCFVEGTSAIGRVSHTEVDFDSVNYLIKHFLILPENPPGDLSVDLGE